MTTPASRTARSRFRKLLARQLAKSEIEIILLVLRAERRNQHFRAGKIGIAESLVKRGWLTRDSAGNVSFSDSTRKILSDCEAAG